jgi:hypothetical protein
MEVEKKKKAQKTCHENEKKQRKLVTEPLVNLPMQGRPFPKDQCLSVGNLGRKRKVENLMVLILAGGVNLKTAVVLTVIKGKVQGA